MVAKFVERDIFLFKKFASLCRKGLFTLELASIICRGSPFMLLEIIELCFTDLLETEEI